MFGLCMKPRSTGNLIIIHYTLESTHLTANAHTDKNTQKSEQTRAIFRLTQINMSTCIDRHTSTHMKSFALINLIIHPYIDPT